MIALNKLLLIYKSSELNQSDSKMDLLTQFWDPYQLIHWNDPIQKNDLFTNLILLLTLILMSADALIFNKYDLNVTQSFRVSPSVSHSFRGFGIYHTSAFAGFLKNRNSPFFVFA